MQEERIIIPPVLNFWAGMAAIVLVVGVVGTLCWLAF